MLVLGLDGLTKWTQGRVPWLYFHVFHAIEMMVHKACKTAVFTILNTTPYVLFIFSGI